VSTAPDSSGTVLWRAGIRVRHFIVRTQWGVLRPAWALAFELILRGVAFSIWRTQRLAVYVGGTFGRGEPIYGISDIDLIVVTANDGGTPGPSRAGLQERWSRLCRAVPPISWLVAEVYMYEEQELREVTSATCLTYGLDRTLPGLRAHPAAFEGSGAPVDEGGLLLRPGLWPTREWRLLAGEDLRPAAMPDAHGSRHAAWLELQFWWRFAYAACLDPSGPHVPYVCVKVVAEPARIWLWLAHGERLLRRRDVLERAAELLPEEEAAIRQALELHDRLHRSPAPPLADLLPCMLRLSTRIARLIETELADVGETPVHLVPGSNKRPIVAASARDTLDRIAAAWPGATPRPLLDWRARTLPQAEDEVFAVIPGRADDPTLLAAAASATANMVYTAVRAHALLAFPIPPSARAGVRALQCRSSDPVSFAVADGLSTAGFPDFPGWSARDCALRAVAEHHAWLHGGTGARALSRGEELAPPLAVTTLGRLLSAARAAAFLESLDADEPRLALTLSSAAEMLADVPGSGTALADDVRAAYEDACVDGRAPTERSLSALFRVVCALSAYATRQQPVA
jgi:hypothetical protein